jgi:hypothetical protein
MKKIFVLIVALLVMGLAVAPQIQAQDMKKLEQLANEAEKIAERIDARGPGGLPTNQEIQRLEEIRQEMIKAAGPYGSLMLNTPEASGQVPQVTQPPQAPVAPKQTQQQPAVQQQGERSGWPPASAFQNRFKITPFKQPAGTTARYDAGEIKGVIISLEIFITGGNATTVVKNLKQKIESVTGKQTTQSGNVYYGFIKDPNYKSEDNLIRFRLEIENNVVTFSIEPVAG